MRFFQWQLYKGNGQPLTGLKSFNISMKNASATQITVKISIWKVPQVTGTNHTNTDASVRKIIEETIPAGTNWTDYSYELDPTATYYGYSIQTVNNPTTEAWLNIDDMYFATAIYNPTLNYSAKSGMVLSGTIVPGAATITIGDNGAVSFTCAGASANNVAGTYSMAMDGADQKITVVVAGTTIVGTYVVDPANNYQVTVTVTSVSGTMASYINNGTVFTGTLS